MTAQPPPPYGLPAYGGPPPPGASPFVTPTGGAAAKTPWLLLVAAFVVGAVVAGVIVFFVRSGGGAQISSSSVTLPEKIGSLQLAKDVHLPDDSSGRLTKIATEQQQDADANAKRLSALHGGAGTAITTYESSDLKTTAIVTAIRTELDPLFVFQADPARLGLAVLTEQSMTYGDVTCIVHYPSTAAGQTPIKSQIFAEVCQRRSSSLTVRIQGLYNISPDKAAQLTDEAFDAITS